MKEDILQQIESSYKMVCEERNKEAPFGLVIDGKALEIALRGDVKNEFLQLAVNCASVICCRVSPKQKALVWHFVFVSCHFFNDTWKLSKFNFQHHMILICVAITDH